MRWNNSSSIVHRPASIVIIALILVGSGFGRTNAQNYTFEEVAAGLKHRDVGTRLRAIQILKDADYADAAGPIGAALEDTDDRVQLAAIDAERSLFTSRPVSRRRKVGFVVEVRTIAGDMAAERQLAIKARPVPTEVLSGLVATLRDANPRVRAEAIDLASLLGPYACSYQGRASDVCNLLGNALIDNINSRVPAIRRAAMRALGLLRYPNAAQALYDQFSFYQSGPDAQAALEGLAGIGHATSASIFRPLLTSPSADTRRLAVEGLARANDREAFPVIQQMGQTERSSSVLLSLHYAHAKAGVPGDSVTQLVAALGNSSLRSLAIQYLVDLASSMGSEVAMSLQTANAETRRLIADVLGFSGDIAVISALEAAAKDPDPDVAAAAQRAIERIRIRRAADAPSR